LPLSAASGTRTMTFQGNGDHFLSGTIQNGGNTVALTKSGSGKLFITGNANSYTGTTIINGGTVQLGNGGVGGKFGTGPVVNNALLQFNRSDNFTFSNDVSGTNGQFIKLNANTVTLTSTNLFLSTSSGAAQINGGTLLINSPGKLVANNEFWIGQNASTGVVTITGGTLISSNWIAIGRNNSAANGTLTLNSGLIQKAGNGNIILGSLGGTGTLTVNGGTISNNSQILLAESATGKGFLVLNGGVVQASSVAKFGGSTATAKFNGGTLQAIADSTAFISGLNSAQIQAGGFTLDDGGFSITNGQALLEDATSPGGGFTKKGSGTATLTVANTFRGDTRINAGVLRLGNLSALQFSTLDLANGDTGTLGFGTLTSAILGGLAGTRNLGLTNQSGLAVALTIGGNGSNTVYSGSLSGNGNLTKNGAGTLVLSGANSYSGSTVVNGGTLVVDGSLGNGSVNINNSTLAGSGTIGGAVTIQATSTLSPGTGIGTLSMNTLTLAGKTVMEISHTGPSSDTVNVAGVLNRGGSLIITNVGGDLAAGDSFTLFNAVSATGFFASITLPTLAPTLRWDTNQFAATGTISVVVVPSPEITAFQSGTNLSLQFPTEVGLSYILEFTTNLIAPVFWLPQTTNQGNGSVMLLQIPIDSQQPQSFYRLQLY
jgi:fibronectin-binding autotransporter adhesin